MKTRRSSSRNRFSVGGASLLLACTVGAVLLTGGSASAAEPESTLEISVGLDPVESVATLLEATGTVIGEGVAYWSVHPAGGTGCGPDPEHDSGYISKTQSPEPGGAFGPGGNREETYHVSADWTPSTAGSYLLCGWLGLGREVAAHASLPFSVRPPHLSVSLRAPATVRVGRRFHVTTTAQAEAPRKLYEYIIPKRGGACPANAAAASSRAHVIDPNLGSGANVNIWSVNGGPFSKTFTESLTRAGAWLVCAYFQYGSTSNPPEAAASAAITASTRTRPPSCHKGFKRRKLHGKARCVKVKKNGH
jgi:hypothetical protein